MTCLHSCVLYLTAMLNGVGLLAGFQLQWHNPLCGLSASPMNPNSSCDIYLPLQAKTWTPDVLLDVRKICDCHATGGILLPQSPVTRADGK